MIQTGGASVQQVALARAPRARFPGTALPRLRRAHSDPHRVSRRIERGERFPRLGALRQQRPAHRDRLTVQNLQGVLEGGNLLLAALHGVLAVAAGLDALLALRLAVRVHGLQGLGRVLLRLLGLEARVLVPAQLHGQAVDLLLHRGRGLLPGRGHRLELRVDLARALLVRREHGLQSFLGLLDLLQGRLRRGLLPGLRGRGLQEGPGLLRDAEQVAHEGLRLQHHLLRELVVLARAAARCAAKPAMATACCWRWVSSAMVCCAVSALLWQSFSSAACSWIVASCTSTSCLNSASSCANFCSISPQMDCMSTSSLRCARRESTSDRIRSFTSAKGSFGLVGSSAAASAAETLESVSVCSSTRAGMCFCSTWRKETGRSSAAAERSTRDVKTFDWSVSAAPASALCTSARSSASVLRAASLALQKSSCAASVAVVLLCVRSRSVFCASAPVFSASALPRAGTRRAMSRCNGRSSSCSSSRRFWCAPTFSSRPLRSSSSSSRTLSRLASRSAPRSETWVCVF